MSNSTNLALPYLAEGQAQKHVTLNETIRRLDAIVQLTVESSTTAAEPGAPGDGQRFILPADKSGAAWGAFASQAIAYYRDGSWEQLAPKEGWLAWAKDDDQLLVFDGTAWTEVSSAGATARQQLTAPRTYYVRTDGSNSNDGLTNTSGGAFLTIQKAIDAVSALDLGVHDVTIAVANGTYADPIQLKSLVGAGQVTISGDAATPANVLISTGANTCINAANITGRWRLSGLKLQATSGGSTCIAADGTTVTLTIGNLDFGAVTTAHLFVQNGAQIAVDAAYTASAGAAYHWGIINGRLQLGAVTLTMSGSPAFASAFCLCTRLGYIRCNAAAFSGAATGKRYDASANGVIFTGGAGATFLPGSFAGTASTGGQYL